MELINSNDERKRKRAQDFFDNVDYHLSPLVKAGLLSGLSPDECTSIVNKALSNEISTWQRIYNL